MPECRQVDDITGLVGVIRQSGQRVDHFCYETYLMAFSTMVNHPVTNPRKS